MNIIELIKKRISRYRLFIRAKRFYDYDRKIFIKESACLGLQNQTQMLANITAREHVLEKGFTMPEMRKCFGKGNLLSLIAMCEEYQKKKYDIYNPLFVQAIKNIKEYKRIHDNLGEKLDEDIVLAINNIEKTFPFIQAEQQLECTYESFFRDRKSDFEQFALSRHTCRNYEGSINISLIYKAIDLAKTAPSACNRQPVRVKVISDKTLQKKILEIQRGNRGFGEKADKLLIITSDVSVYNGIFERNCPYVDGGIFLMNMLYALHYYGIASCTLNWSATDDEDKKMKKILLLPDSEVVVGILTCGIPPKKFKIAKSQRLDTNSIVKVY